MKKQIRNIKGITLIALVVTIIVLLILSGISITLVFDGNGILKVASNSAETYKISQIQERLELLKTLVMPGTLDDYMDRLQEECEKYKASEFEQLDVAHWTVVMEDKYEFLIYTDANIEETRKVSSRSNARSITSGNITIEFQGEVNTGLLELSEKKGTLQYPNTRIFSVTKNTSGGKLSVISADDSIASASIEGNVVTITPKLTNKDGKRVIITVMSEPRGNYLRQKAKYTATVNKGSMTIEATPYEGEFDGQKHPALKNVTVDPEDAKLTYSINEGGYTEEIPEVEMTGTYTVSIRAEKEGYATQEITKTVTINKQGNKNESENPNLVISPTSGTITYPTPGTFSVIKNTSGGNLSVSSSDESTVTASIDGNTVTMTPQAIGGITKTATITVKAQATENYEEQTATYTVTVIGNRAPSKAQVAFNTKGTNYIKVNAKSTDADGDKLTYTLRYGTSSSNLNLSTDLSNQTQDVQVPIQTPSNLSSYTYYSWRVDVSDGKTTTLGDVQSQVRTFCPGTGHTCYGPFIQTNGARCTASGCVNR